MKKLISLLAALILALSLVSFSAAAEDTIVGKWDGTQLFCEGNNVSPEDIRAQYPDFLVTIEFTDNGIRLSTVYMGGEMTGVDAALYSVNGIKVTIGGIPQTWKVENDTLELFFESGAVSFSRIADEDGADAPLDPSAVVGEWDYLGYFLPNLDMTETEFKQTFGDDACTIIEFTADGRIVLTARAMGISQSQNYGTYSVSGGQIFLDGAPAAWTIRYDHLIIVGENVNLVLPRYK